ncbi:MULTISPECIES: hypothetical protein [Sporosarcina]|nr:MULTISPECIES: hypothetical protein [Sporosarcina]GKV65173.1 hypothetical protein NCCP2331_13260 [Sporosarcina sp. NCCP-2331]GLB55297.1 hypothetical protein NCCP2378_10830 [Sporosarcina sp. NCCP-2378]
MSITTKMLAIIIKMLSGMMLEMIIILDRGEETCGMTAKYA